ncbi:MAG: hypothetical protein N0A03_10520, partial [Anaerolineae bacterium]|nr:hypothetical protein [Anaerolineae bacterium]
MAYKLTRTKKGYYCIRIQVGGVRKTAYAKTEAEARAKLKALQQQALLDGGFANAHKRTLQDLVTAWLQSVHIRETTRANYEQTLRLRTMRDTRHRGAV